MSDTFAHPQKTVPRRLLSALVQIGGRQIAYLRTRAELETMDDRTLADLGLTRDTIAQVARRHAAAT